MSIFKAGERNKLCGEDICTSFVFGAMDVLDRQTFFKKFLQNLDIDFSKNDLNSAKFDFWTKINKKDSRIPDVIIKSNANLIYVENKIIASLNSKQLFRQLREEFKEGNKNNRHNILIYMTNDTNEPQEVREKLNKYFTSSAENIKWHNWTSIYKLISEEISNHSIDSTSKRLLEELKSYLQNRILNKPEFCGVIASINPNDYDGANWLNDVLKRRQTRYSSRRARELAYEDQKLLLYSTIDQAILGEATICSYNDAQTGFWYDFKDSKTNKSTFIKYKNKVSLKRLKKLGINIQILKNITRKEYVNIRKLSKS